MGILRHISPEEKKRRDRHNEIIKIMEESLPALRAFARGLVFNNMVADDLVQSACERALNRLDQVHDISGVRSWLNRIVYTQWQDVLRRRQRRKKSLSILGQNQEESLHSAASQNEESVIAKLDIHKALQELSDEHQAAVVLVSMLGYEYEEVAKILGVPQGTVASRVARARSLMAKSLKKEKSRKLKVISEKEASK